MSDSHIDECTDGQCCSDEACQDESGGCCQGSNKQASGCCGGAAKAALVPMTVEQLEGLQTLQLIARFRRGIENFDRRVFDLTEKELDTAFLPEAGVGLWPVRVLVGHIADADLAAIHRMRRAVAEDHPLLAEWDENAFVDMNLYGNQHEGYAEDAEADRARVMQSLGGHMAVIHTLRQWTGQWLLTLTDAQLSRTAMHPTRGELSVRKILAMYTWHLEHHAEFLRKKLDKLVGPAGRAAPAVKKAGSCGSGCGCAG